MSKTACVYLVGAGPGSADLLTVKAFRLIQTADVIVYDRLVSKEVLELAGSTVTKIYVGKQNGYHAWPQSAINKLLVKLVNENRHIVRLKGGDPFVFGRGSEEASYLRQRDIDFEVVPGVTAASACSAYAGIPLTHRGIASGVEFISGHLLGTKPLQHDWNKLTDPDKTLVIYMGLSNLAQICDRIIAAGLAADTPAAAIESGASEQQRLCVTTLENLAQETEKQSFKSPTIIVIGEVVKFSHELGWFKSGYDLAHAVRTANG